MMYAIYRIADGVVVKHVTCPSSDLARNTPSGCAAIEGAVDARRFTVDPQTKQLIDHGLPAQEEALDEQVKQLAREAIEAIEAGQVRTLREALLGDAAAIDRLREQEPAIAAARAVLQRPRPSAKTSGQALPATEGPPAE